MRSEALQNEKGTPKELAYFIELANEISPYFQLPSIEPEVKALKNKRSVYFLGKSNDDYLNCVYETYARVASYLQDNSFEASDFFDLLTAREGKHNAIYKYNEVQKARENLQTIIYLNRKAIECMYLSDYNITASLTLSGEIYLELNEQGRLVVSEGRFIKAINGVEIWRIRECEMCEYIFWANRRDQVCCTKQCANAFRVRRHRQKYAQDPVSYKLRRYEREAKRDACKHMQPSEEAGVKRS